MSFFKQKVLSSPETIHEGYTFPDLYITFGDVHHVNDLEINDTTVNTHLFIGSRKEINILVKDIIQSFELDDYSDNHFSIIGVWDNYENKTDNDLLMLATFCSDYEQSLHLRTNEKLLEKMFYVVDNSTSEGNPMIAWGHLQQDIVERELSEKDGFSIARVFLNNINHNMYEYCEKYTDVEYLQEIFKTPTLKHKFK